MSCISSQETSTWNIRAKSNGLNTNKVITRARLNYGTTSLHRILYVLKTPLSNSRYRMIKSNQFFHDNRIKVATSPCSCDNSVNVDVATLPEQYAAWRILSDLHSDKITN